MKRTIGIIVFVVVLPTTALAIIYFILNNKAKPVIGKQFPDIPVKAIGKRWMAVFIKPNCSHCFNMMADIADISSENLSIFVYSIADEKSTQEFLDSYSFPFPVLQNKSVLTTELFVRSVPHVFLIDSFGIIQFHWKGRRTKQNIKELLLSFTSSGKIPLNQFNTETNTFGQPFYFDLKSFIQNDNTLNSLVDEFYQNREIANELYSTKLKNGEAILTQYFVYWNNCGCEEDNTDFTYFSLTIDHQSDSVQKNHFGRNISLDSINQVKSNLVFDFYGIKN